MSYYEKIPTWSMLAAFAAVAGAAESPAIVIHSDAYRTVGASNSSSILRAPLPPARIP